MLCGLSASVITRNVFPSPHSLALLTLPQLNSLKKSTRQEFRYILLLKLRMQDLLEENDEEVVIGELMRVVEERRQRTRRSVGIRKKVKEAYIPLHRFKALYIERFELNRLQRWYVTIPSLDQWWTTIENHRYQWLPDPKTIEKPLILMVGLNHSIQW